MLQLLCKDNSRQDSQVEVQSIYDFANEEVLAPPLEGLLGPVVLTV